MTSSQPISTAVDLIADGPYYDLVHAFLQQYWIPFVGLPVVDLPIAQATHSSQDTLDTVRFQYWLDAPTLFDEQHTTGVVLAIRDHDRLMIYDGNHRFAAAKRRGARTVRARIYHLDALLP